MSVSNSVSSSNNKMPIDSELRPLRSTHCWKALQVKDLASLIFSWLTPVDTAAAFRAIPPMRKLSRDFFEKITLTMFDKRFPYKKDIETPDYDAFIEQLPHKCPRMRSIEIVTAGVGCKVFKSLIDRCPNLTNLVLDKTSICGEYTTGFKADLSMLKCLIQLKTFTLQLSISHGSLDFLPALHSLTELNIDAKESENRENGRAAIQKWQSKVADNIRQCRSLKTIIVKDIMLSPSLLLSRNVLETLMINRYLEPLSNLPNLRTLGITHLSEHLAKSISGLKNVTTLIIDSREVREPGVTTNNLRILKNVVSVTTIILIETDLTDAGLNEMAEFPSLTSLHVCSNEDIQKIGARAIPSTLAPIFINLDNQYTPNNLLSRIPFSCRATLITSEGIKAFQQRTGFMHEKISKDGNVLKMSGVRPDPKLN